MQDMLFYIPFCPFYLLIMKNLGILGTLKIFEL
ncbi:hypothetical protein RJ641_003297 [Dillenia turbinata]|uniref:Uncharacterized protein n=1 Tax=Dillenia turbinata TaxID=194707 RepID=A0AAN8VGX9_9MAGN